MLETWKAKKQQYYCIGTRHLDFMKLFWTRKDKELTENKIWNRSVREDFFLSKSLNLHFHQYTVYFLSQQAVSHLFWRTEILSFTILNFTQLRQPDFVILFVSMLAMYVCIYVSIEEYAFAFISEKPNLSIIFLFNVLSFWLHIMAFVFIHGYILVPFLLYLQLLLHDYHFLGLLYRFYRTLSIALCHAW